MSVIIFIFLPVILPEKNLRYNTLYCIFRCVVSVFCVLLRATPIPILYCSNIRGWQSGTYYVVPKRYKGQRVFSTWQPAAHIARSQPPENVGNLQDVVFGYELQLLYTSGVLSVFQNLSYKLHRLQPGSAKKAEGSSIVDEPGDES